MYVRGQIKHLLFTLLFAIIFFCNLPISCAEQSAAPFFPSQLRTGTGKPLKHTDFDRTSDLPTQRDINEPVPSGSLKGWQLDIEKYNQMLDEYYDLHGWNRQTSFPKRRTLTDLGLESVADDLEKIGKLG